MDKQRYSSKLKPYKQEHLIQFWDKLSDDERSLLTQQIDSIDFELLNELASKKSQQVDIAELAKKALSPKAIRLDCTPEQTKSARAAGEDAIRNGHVGMVLVAGGQGTRLGFDLPKGMFPIAPLSQRTLFQMHVDSLRGAMKKYQCEIPLFIMTSPATDKDTRTYFAQNDNLGLPSHLLHIFQQGVMPAVDASSGKVLLESESKSQSAQTVTVALLMQ
jgi:UDP-N-acetylglucosamine/UDP-N-acetylgalactosamine diphosphorylase